jgi:hypothetical protein
MQFLIFAGKKDADADAACPLSRNIELHLLVESKLFEVRCSNCHQFPEPMMLNAKQWKIVLLTMQQRMQHLKMAPLNEDEFKTIHDYLSAHSR